MGRGLVVATHNFEWVKFKLYISALNATPQRKTATVSRTEEGHAIKKTAAISRETAVTVYLTIKQLLLFAFVSHADKTPHRIYYNNK